MKPLLELRRVFFRYGKRSPYILSGVNLKIIRGKVYCIVGENGSGKTTLLHIMAGLLEPEKGEVLLDGKPLKEQLPRARRLIGILFQNPETMLFNPTVYDEIAYAPRQLFDEGETRKRVLESARLLGIEDLLERPTTSLSYGEKKVVALASIISYDPEIILLDEPLSNLHPERKRRVLNMIRSLAAKGKAVVITSPDLELLDNICDVTLTLSEGRLKEGG
ncbi:MAG: energy-coupling factor ABC transporter ATP-binding protein [Desulfurococcales archaeon]|nr:energy-coupling factor ABC transporter ATP-binding protein [Desulfurococcales archaeon]